MRWKSSVLIPAMLLVTCMAVNHVVAKDKEVRPSWVDDREKEFPRESYLSSIGIGDSPEAARNSAMVNISQMIEVDIKSQQNVIEQYFETGTDKNLNMLRSSNLSHTASMVTKQSLKNVVVARTWYSKEDARHYALAYIDRSETSAIYVSEIERLDGLVQSYYAGYKSAESKLTRLAYLDRAISNAVERDIFRRQLATIAASPSEYAVSVSPSELIQARHQLQQGLRISLKVNDVGWPEFENSVRESLEDIGFKVVTDGADYRVDGHLRIERLDRPEIFVGWYLDLHLVDIVGNSEFLTFNDSGREGHLTVAEAERRAARSVRATIMDKFYKRTVSYLSTLIAPIDGKE
jgi:hypothetical protein